VVLAVLIAQIAVAGGSDEGKIASLQRQIDALKVQVGAPAKTAKKKKSKRGPAGPPGAPGAPGAQGAQGSADAAPVFAQVAANGTVNAANSEGLTQANVINTAPIIGYYCFGNLPFVPRGGSATIDFLSGGSVDTIAPIGLGSPGGGLCPAGTQAFVDTRRTDSTGSTPVGFFITLYR
jgi:hypothetical protein